MQAVFEPFFLSTGRAPGDQRLCVFHPARGGTPKAAVLCVHPFAEELNKSRRMLALQAGAFARAGCDVLQIDLLGCGDSSGEFSDASWTAWIEDLELAQRWLANRSPAPLWLWGVRAGALLAVEFACCLPNTSASRLLLWQPQTSGKTVLQQFVRLRTTRDQLAGNPGSSAESLRAELATQGRVDIAGYPLGAALATGLEQARLVPPAQPGHAHWLEVSSREGAELSPALDAAARGWRAAGWSVRTQVVPGPQFWQTSEIECAPSLIDASLACLALPETTTA